MKTRGLDYQKFVEFCKLEIEYSKYWEKYSESEISLQLDEIAGGMIPRLRKELFNAWFPQLENFDLVEQANGEEYHHYGYDAFSCYWNWYTDCDEEQIREAYDFFNTKDLEEEESLADKIDKLIKLDQMLTAAERSAGLLPIVEEETLVLN